MPAPAPFVTRFAPSPTGWLHRGHAFSAVTAFRAAQAAEGRFLLRIEDIDTARCRPEYEAGIYEDLAWLGIDWEEPVRRQSAHLQAYRGAVEQLVARGLLYRCFRTRQEVAAEIGRAPHGASDAPAFRGGPLPEAEERRRLEAGEAFAWRLSLEAARAALGHAYEQLTFVEEGAGPDGEPGIVRVEPAREGDVILARKDLGVAYHLAVVVDDALQGITHVIRGEDLFAAAHVQRLLQALLGLPAPRYRHHRLLLRPDGKRFAKRDTAETLRQIRAEGVRAEDLIAELGLD